MKFKIHDWKRVFQSKMPMTALKQRMKRTNIELPHVRHARQFDDRLFENNSVISSIVPFLSLVFDSRQFWEKITK